MKGAILCADKFTTVSPTYAKELTFPISAFGLDGIIRDNEYKMIGILNGIDTISYNPETDPYIKALYSSENLRGKKRCKQDLQKSLVENKQEQKHCGYSCNYTEITHNSRNFMKENRLNNSLKKLEDICDVASMASVIPGIAEFYGAVKIARKSTDLFKAAAAIYQTGFICQLKAALLIKCTRIKVCFQYPKHDRTILIF